MKKSHIASKPQRLLADAVWAVGDAVDTVTEMAAFAAHGVKKCVKKFAKETQKEIDEYGEGVAELKALIADKLREN